MIEISVFLTGLVIGSFLNVCIYRIPGGQSLLRPGSSCPECNQKIPFYYNLPLISYILLRGRCAYCSKRISIRYPLIELISGLVALLLFWRFGLSNEFPFYLIFSFFLIVIAWIDIETQLIHNKVLIVMMFCAILLNYVFQVVPWYDALLGFALGGTTMFLFAVVGKSIFKKEALGMGDVKFSAVAGFFLGWKVILIAIYFGFVLALLSVIVLRLIQRLDFETRIPLGPFLAGGLLLYIVFGEYLVSVYLDIFMV